MKKAVFLDRDGVINELVYHHEQEVIDSPFTVNQFKLIADVIPSLKIIKEKGFLTVLVSNQPGIAKGQMTPEVFHAINNNMEILLRSFNVDFDGVYYCLHHPAAVVPEYRMACECRKPKPGLLLQAQKDMDIDLSQSWMIGDNLSDIEAGQSAGCRTILISKMKCETCMLMAQRQLKPDYTAVNLTAAVSTIM